MRHLIVVTCADSQGPGRKPNFLHQQQTRPITVCSTTPASLRCAGRLRAPPAGGDAEGGGGARQAGRGGLCRGAAGRAQDARGELRLRRAGGRPPRMQSCCARAPPVWFSLEDRLHSGYDALAAVPGAYSRPALQCRPSDSHLQNGSAALLLLLHWSLSLNGNRRAASSECNGVKS